MRAVAVSAFGATPEVIELPRPEPGPGELLVRLAAAGLNPMDWKAAEGEFDGHMPHTFPLVLGFDGAGTVEAVGEGVARFAVGDHVYGQFFRAPIGNGTYAEYVVVPERLATGAVARPPDGVPAPRAAALPTAGITALGAVREAGVSDGQTVLIVGATGGVGSFLTQLAAARGAKVVATARADAAAAVRELGAAETVDYDLGPIDEGVRSGHPDGVDVLLDLVSDATSFARHARLVRAGGIALSLLFAADEPAQAARGVRGVNYAPRGKQRLLDQLSAEVRDAGLRIPIEATVPLDQAPAALARNRAGGSRGKTVIRI